MRYVYLKEIYNTKNLNYPINIIKMISNQQAGDWQEYLRTYDLWWEQIDWKLNEHSVVLDIGAGCGITSLWLQKKYGCRIILLDTTDELENLKEPIWGWHASETNSLSAVREFWKANDAEFEFQDAHNVNWNNIPELDLVLSKSSWGVHYHIDTYFSQVHERNPNYMYVNWRSISPQHSLFLDNSYAIQPVGHADHVNKTWLYKIFKTKNA